MHKRAKTSLTGLHETHTNTLNLYINDFVNKYLNAVVTGVNQILRDNVRVWYDWSYMVAWCGVGLALLSAILFSSAAICLRGEREREEALNMQYLMPGNTFMLRYSL